ncbi:MAG: DUF11 domain-containing protein, partial [Chloroflexi bacterium]|nr:DUF11 domain-containing protein [Chloroflexota bacterium]
MSITLPKIKKVLKPFIPITMMLLMGFLLLYQPIAAQSTVTGIISNGSVQGQVPAVNTNNGRTPSFAIERNMVTDTVIISEVRTDQPSTDNDEYFELAGDAGTALDTLTYIVIGDDGSGGSGTIESVTSLSGSIAAGGFYLGVESTFSLTTTADLTATLGFENSDNVTHMLVSNFTGSLGDDIDTDDDGNIDNAPWSALINCIGLVESIGSGDAIYCATTVGPDGIFVPGHAYNCPLSWVIGQFTVGIDDTPRAANSCPAGDLTIGKSGPAIAQPGDTISYTINYDNIGADLADNVVISDTLPPYVSYLSDNSGLSCIACTPGATGTITWSLGTVTPTTPASFVIMTLISDSVPFATTLTNT